MVNAPRASHCYQCERPIDVGEQYRDHKTFNVSVHTVCLDDLIKEAASWLALLSLCAGGSAKLDETITNMCNGWHWTMVAA